jgi:signal transduction histidine kinase
MRIAGLAAIYVFAARLGLSFDPLAGFATLVWPPTGIALAALLLFGLRLWPGVFLGAAIANLLTGASPGVALGIGIGNSAEAVVAAYLLQRIPSFLITLESGRSAIALIVIGGLLSTTISASIGVLALGAGGVVATAAISETWRAWWVGDMVGAVLVTPLILVWSRAPLARFAGRLVECLVLAVAVGVVSFLSFFGDIPQLARLAAPFYHLDLILAVMIWAAVRFGQRGAATTSVFLSAVAITATVSGHGPFDLPDLHEGLLSLQTFMAILGATFLFLGGTIAERQRALDSAREARAVAVRRAAEERALREAIGEVAAGATTGEIIRKIATTAAEATGADACFIERPNIKRDEVEVAGMTDNIPAAWATPVAFSNAFYMRAVFDSREPLLINRLAELEGALGAGPLPRTWPEGSGLVIPLIAGDKPIGALFLLRAPGKPGFSSDEVTRASTFGQLASLAFRRMQLLEESQQRREELERVTESRTRLVRGFSHDVQNPLGAADGYAQLLADGAQGSLSERQLEAVEHIRRSIRASMSLIRELLDVTRAEAGQIPLVLARADVAALAREATQDFQAQARIAGLTLVVNAPEPLFMETDPRRVRQILDNILSNAVKYSAKGTVTVTAQIADRGRAGGGEWVAVSVADNGPGIPEEKQERVFQEFTRLDPNQPRGTGLGLAMGRRLARQLGGDITLKSEIGHGSTFTLLLPKYTGAIRSEFAA